MIDTLPAPRVPIAVGSRPWNDASYQTMGRDIKPDEPFGEVLRRARAGVGDALDELFRRSRAKLGGAASKHVDGRHPAGARPSDIAQESAERALRHLHTFEGTTEAEWFSWIERIVRTTAAQSLRHARRKKRAIPGGLPFDAPEVEMAPSPRTSPSHTVHRKEEWRILLACIHELPEDQQQAFKMRHLDELTCEDIALRMGKTPKSVKGLVARAVKDIQARIKETDAASLIERIRALRPSK